MVETAKKPRWRACAIRVDMAPIADRAHALVDQRLERVKAKEAAYTARGKRSKHNLERGVGTMLAHEVGFCGEIATARLLGGRVRVEEGKDGDVQLRSGRRIEVKTTFKGWPFGSVKWPPRATAHEKYHPTIDVVLCVTGAPPVCYEQVWVLGWIEPRVLAEIGTQPSGTWWSFPWSEQYWRHVAELMNDELADPCSPPGAPNRRFVGDLGDLARLPADR